MIFRFKAFFAHLAISFLIALLAVWLVFNIWYPAPLHSLLGATDIFLLLLVVDVVLGPVLTLIVSKPHKKSLKLDLTVIFMLQISAFGYGMLVVADGRPIWLVYTGDRFEVVQAYELESQYTSVASNAFSNKSWFGPLIVGAKIPEDPEKRSDLIFLSLGGGADLAQRPDLFVPYVEVISTVSERAQPLSWLAVFNEQSDVSEALDKWSEADAYLPLYNRNKGAFTVLLKRDSADVLAIVELKPW